MNKEDIFVGAVVSDRVGKVFMIDRIDGTKCEAKQIKSEKPVSEYIKYLRPVPLNGSFILRIGDIKHDQRTGWFRWGKDGMHGIRLEGASWKYKMAINNDVSIERPDILFVHEFQKLYNKTI